MKILYYLLAIALIGTPLVFVAKTDAPTPPKTPEFSNPQTAEQLAPGQPKIIWAVITAYSSTEEQTDDTPFITALGTDVRDGIVAANFLAFGTRVKIPELFGNKEFVVEDRMHHRFSDRIDIWFEDTDKAKEFGKQYTIVEILPPKELGEFAALR